MRQRMMKHNTPTTVTRATARAGAAWLLIGALGAAGCTPARDRCDHDQKYLHGLCYEPDAGVDAAGDAGSDAGLAASSDGGAGAAAAPDRPAGSGAPRSPAR